MVDSRIKWVNWPYNEKLYQGSIAYTWTSFYWPKHNLLPKWSVLPQIQSISLDRLFYCSQLLKKRSWYIDYKIKFSFFDHLKIISIKLFLISNRFWTLFLFCLKKLYSNIRLMRNCLIGCWGFSRKHTDRQTDKNL